jgi:hypothetical protein
MKLQLIALLLFPCMLLAQGGGQVVNSPTKSGTSGGGVQIVQVSPSGATCTTNTAPGQLYHGTLYTCQGGTYQSSSGQAPVQSVAGKTGAVTLAPTDIPGFTAAAATASPVQSVATKTGAVTLSPSDISGIAPVASSNNYSDLTNLPAIPTQAPSYSPNQITSGCSPDYQSGLTFIISSCKFTMNGTSYSLAAATTVTLATADATNPRFDVIYVGIDTSGNPKVDKLTGTAASNPVIPSVDASQQIAVSPGIYIPSGATAPSSTTKTTLFDEGTEWTLTPTTNVAQSTVNPYQGTKSIAFTSAVLGNGFTLVKPTAGTEDLSGRNTLVLSIRTAATWPTGNSGASAARTVSLWWKNGTTQVGSQVVISNGQFGFNSATTGTYQTLSIPISLFNTGSNLVTTLQYQVTGNTGTSTLSMWVDNISLQGGVTVTPIPSNLLAWKGNYSTTASYNPNDLVVSSGVAYVALASNLNQAVSSTQYWQPLSSATQPYDIPFSLPGLPTASTTYPWITIVRPVTIPANFTGSDVTCGTNPTSTAVFTINRTRSGSTAAIGTLSISTSCVGTYTSTGGTAVQLIAKDRLTVSTPSSQDATLADVAATVIGTR